MGDIMQSYLSNGGLIVYPTSTLPGLGCLPTKSGLDNLFKAKNRLASMPVSLGVSSINQVADFVEVPDFLEDFLDQFVKGGITTILPAKTKQDARLGGDYIAIRVFSHPSAVKLAEKYGPITATSANESGEMPLANTEDAAKNLGIEQFVPGICPNGVGSTYVKFEKNNSEMRGWRLTLMREGVVPHSDVKRWWTVQA